MQEIRTQDHKILVTFFQAAPNLQNYFLKDKLSKLTLLLLCFVHISAIFLYQMWKQYHFCHEINSNLDPFETHLSLKKKLPKRTS